MLLRGVKGIFWIEKREYYKKVSVDMNDTMTDSNCVQVIGLMKTIFTYDHDVDSGCEIYGAELEIPRRNCGYPDVLPITVSDQIVDVARDYTGQRVQVAGVLCPNDAEKPESGKHNLSVVVHSFETAVMIFVIFILYHMPKAIRIICTQNKITTFENFLCVSEFKIFPKA
ncbi:MAG: hypothetical protein LIO96_06570 [Lachnospiraceae bacterium]|nr:hypothetical protein [Lachnospiraceae bacterium]